MKIQEILKKENAGKKYIMIVGRAPKPEIYQVTTNYSTLFSRESGESIEYTKHLIDIINADFEEYIEEVEWSTIENDTKILVSNDCRVWYKRHFAKYENGRVYTWLQGTTSFSRENNFTQTIDWKYAKLYKES